MASNIRQPSSKDYTKRQDDVDNLEVPMSPLLELQKLWMHTIPNEDSSDGNASRPNERIYNPPRGDRHNQHLSRPKENRVSDINKKNEQNADHEEERFSGNIQKFRKLTSLDDIKSLRLWKAVMAEFLGTLILVLVGCGSCIQDWSSDYSIILSFNDTEVPLTNNFSTPDIVQIALAFGLSVTTVVWIIGHVSGGHINPAVTCAMVITRNVSLARGILYIVGQLLGAIAGAGILLSVTPKERQGTLGCTLLGQGVNDVMGIFLELFITFILVLTVFAACDKRRKDLGGSFPLSIGLSVTTCHLFAVRFTGSSMNTARSFGPAVVMGIWTDHWVYWIGPIIGGMLAGFVYDNVFAVNASVMKCQAFLFSSQYEHESHPPGKLRFRVLEEDDQLLNLEENLSSHVETGKTLLNG
ncbi:hypothetical protein CHS0354_023398 [Potamilus streckersoni]|uniref:Uncharacterized protein n=1 Tax=Potamilus streckersoni TaxID=2493646 RepID=A0AAE0TBV9_9BIVA|nr:hypothetical protein CHS0354_023398 [Potamilus streckersoni]